MKNDQENNDAQNIVPLSSDEIKSILKSQSESVFEDKNITNNSNFVQKSLIDIALDFKSKENIQEDNVSNDTSQGVKNLEENDIENIEEKKIEDVKINSNNLSKKTTDIENETLQTDYQNDVVRNDENIDKVNEKTEEPAESYKENNSIDDGSHNKIEKNDIGDDKTIPELMNVENETQQALDSVRDAVSQSMNKSDDEKSESLDEDSLATNNVSDKINKDYEDFKNIFSTLSSLGETAIYEAVENKILEIAYEIAGYQIDKMPEKYEKKIKSFLKNINCYEEKITIEINDKDFEALSKLKHFNINEDKTVFVSNKELSRGDIILNCDGMNYSEKSLKIT